MTRSTSRSFLGQVSQRSHLDALDETTTNEREEERIELGIRVQETRNELRILTGSKGNLGAEARDAFRAPCCAIETTNAGSSRSLRDTSRPLERSEASDNGNLALQLFHGRKVGVELTGEQEHNVLKDQVAKDCTKIAESKQVLMESLWNFAQARLEKRRLDFDHGVKNDAKNLFLCRLDFEAVDCFWERGGQALCGYVLVDTLCERNGGHDEVRPQASESVVGNVLEPETYQLLCLLTEKRSTHKLHQLANLERHSNRVR